MHQPASKAIQNILGSTNQLVSKQLCILSGTTQLVQCLPAALVTSVVLVLCCTGLQSWDIKGAYGYHLITAMALLLADAVHHTVRGLITAFLDWRNPEGSEEAAAAATAAAASSAQEASPSPMHGGELGPGLKQRKPKKKRSKHAWKLEALKILDSDTLSDASTLQFSLAAMERALRQHIFMSDAAWSWAGIVGFVVLSAVTVGALPVLFSIGSGAPAGGADMATASGLQWYFLLVAAPLTAMAAFANARGGGAVDINLADSWAKLAVLIFAAWAGTGNAGSVGAGLLCGGVVLGATTSALNTMYAWRSGYMTMTSPTAIFVAYMIGLAVGCVVAPAAWLMLESTSVAAAAVAASPLTTGGLLAPDKFYASPLVSVFRSTAALATAGLSVLPHAAPYVALAAFVVGLGLNLVRESLPSYLKGVVPYPAAVGVVFLSGANVAVDVVVGAAIRIFWRLVSLLCLCTSVSQHLQDHALFCVSGFPRSSKSTALRAKHTCPVQNSFLAGLFRCVWRHALCAPACGADPPLLLLLPPLFLCLCLQSCPSSVTLALLRLTTWRWVVP